MSNDNKTLIILSPGFPANEADTNCLPFPQSFVKNLKLLHPSLHIIVLAFHYPFSAGVYQWCGTEVHSLNGKDKGKIRRLMTWILARKKIKEIVQSHNVTGILSFWLGECALVAGYASKKYNLPAFTWLLGQDARQHNRYISLVKPSAASLIALSDAVSDELFKNYGLRPAHTIPAGIDKELFIAAGKKREIDILGAGSLIPLKQYDQFIAVVANLARYRPSLKVVLCGAGPEEEKLKQLIIKNRLSGVILLMGKVEHAKVLELMQVTKIFLHPSSYEGFSTVCGEALYAGAHVVSYCQPMKRDFDHLYIVKNLMEMEATVKKLLQSNNLDHSPVLTYPIADCCEKIIALYN